MTPETEIKHQIKDYLAIKGIFNFPLLQGLAAHKGLPDRIAVHRGKIYAIEVKSPKGKLSAHQEAFRGQLEASGGVYVVARGYEDLEKYF